VCDAFQCSDGIDLVIIQTNSSQKSRQSNHYHFSSQQYENASYIHHPHLCTDRMTASFLSSTSVHRSLIQHIIAIWIFQKSYLLFTQYKW
jgi:hypothetical protein